ncbi:cobalt transporter CbiM [Roseinatronobacter monicus]|uniref:Cobalt/nickel transport system permease protein n=1 Tax=Roseinatronobacter monicus TaxID=393481 RepID=A0A543KAQ4_9RHOB|nr:cobalt transporter CbiM [Roseinatronobacter monicus]TQM92168.1 cobalt/nickel transport system permease protein [Roseinatronobacter monicus]
MHLPDGLVPVELALAGYAGSGVLAAVALSRIKRLPDPSAAIPRAAMLTTVFFAASLVAVPVPPASVHLMLAGLLGVMLGWFAVPAILVGLFLQAVLFGHGGLTTLGLNGLILGLPALLAFGIWRAAGRRWPDMAALCAGSGAVVAALAIFAGFVLLGLPVALDTSAERVALQLFVLAHVPLVLAEGVIVLVLLRVLRRTAPQMLAHA